MWVSEFLLVSIDLSTAAKFTLVGFLLLTHALQAETLKIMECQAQMIKSIKSLTLPGQFARCSQVQPLPLYSIPIRQRSKPHNLSLFGHVPVHYLSFWAAGEFPGRTLLLRNLELCLDRIFTLSQQWPTLAQLNLFSFLCYNQYPSQIALCFGRWNGTIRAVHKCSSDCSGTQLDPGMKRIRKQQILSSHCLCQ